MIQKEPTTEIFEMKPQRITLDGKLIQLKPLELTDLEKLAEVGLEPDLWKWTPHVLKTIDDLKDYLRDALEKEREGKALPFVIVEKSSGKYVGCTRYGEINVHHRRLEIGWTWVGKNWQRKGINSEAKFLLLQHAFEELKCLRVELKTDRINEKSRTAIERIGAKQEGILRHHVINHDGRIRDTVYYSITAEEWPDVKQKLEQRRT